MARNSSFFRVSYCWVLSRLMLSRRVPASSSSFFRSISTCCALLLSAFNAAALAASCASRFCRCCGIVFISVWICRIFCCRFCRTSNCSSSACTRACYGRTEVSSIARACFAAVDSFIVAPVPMARLPLFQEIQRAMRIASWAERKQVRSSEALERMETARWNRRQFLKTAVAAAAGASVTPIFQAAAKGPQAPAAVIIGAGTAGLTCAYRLQQNGIAARVFEASTRAGGRMFSLRNFFPDNQLTELGGEYIDSGHATMRRLVKELDLTLNDLGADKKPAGDHSFFFDNRLVTADAEFIDLFRPIARAIARDLKLMKVRENGKMEISYTTPHAGEVDRLSIPEWFEKRGISGLPTKILRAAYVGEYGLEIDQQSALNLLLTMGDETPPDEVRIFGPSDERFHIVEGNDSVPTRLAERLKTPVEFGTRLEAIAGDGDGFRLTLRNDTSI